MVVGGNADVRRQVVKGERKEERLEGGRGGGWVMCVCVRGREKGGD